MGVLRTVLLVAGSIVGLVVLVAVVAYASDYAVEANVVERTTPCRAFGGNEVTVQTKLFGIEATVGGLPYQQCLAVNAGSYVVYHIRSGRTSLYQSEGGPCIFDSEGGVAGC